MKIRKFFLPALFVLFVLFIILNPQQSFHSAFEGLKLWSTAVLPSLLPFFIGSGLLIQFGVVDFLSTLTEPVMKPLFRCPGSAAYVFIMSITSGYPMGAKLTSQLCNQEKLTQIEAQRVLSFCNTSGPLFMIGAVAIGMLGNAKLGTIIALSHYSAAILTGILFRYYGQWQDIQIQKNQRSRLTDSRRNIFSKALSNLYYHQIKREKTLGDILGESVQSSIQSVLTVGGFITLFSVIISILQASGLTPIFSHFLAPLLSFFRIPTELAPSIVSGFFEITTGCKNASMATAGLGYKVAVISAIISWGGLSVHAQTLSFLGKAQIRTGPYFLAKSIQSILAYFLSFYGTLLFYKKTAPVFLPVPNNEFSSWITIFLTSTSFFAGSILILLMISLFSALIHRIKIIKFN